MLFGFLNRQGGSISPIKDWLHFGDHPVAPFRRSQDGSNSVISNWPHFGDHAVALYHRSMTGVGADDKTNEWVSWWPVRGDN